jgi:phosphate transport system substrate-binding protein
VAGGSTIRILAVGAAMGALVAQTPGEPSVSGKIRIWGHGSRTGDFAGDLVRRWNQGFQRLNPGVQFEVALRGDSAAIGGVYTGAADLALMGREIWPIEMEGFEQATNTKPLEVSVMTGSLNVPRHSFALVIFVHKDNPLSKMTLAEADAIFGADHRRGSKNIRQWGDLGLAGEWTGRSIHLYGFAIQQDFSQFFQQAVMSGSKKWNCDLREFRDVQHAGGPAVEAGQQILDALAKDPAGIAVSSLAYGNPNCKPLALSDGSDEFVLPSRDSVMARRYPLARPVNVVVSRPAGVPLDPKIRRYLAFLLSPEGQRIVAEDGGYLPLPETIARQERMKLQ